MHLIYLDQNVWVAMLRGCQSGDSTAEKLKRRLIEMREAGRAAIPLSGYHYLETWHRGEPGSRHALAELMREVTAYATLAPVYVMERAWVRSEIWRRCNLATAPPDAEVLGYGVNHAFATPTGRFRVVSAIATDAKPEGPPADVPADLIEAGRAGGEHWEWLNLSGPEDLLVMDGIDVRPEHRLGTEDANYEATLRKQIQSDERLGQRLADMIVTQEVIRVLDYINDACEELGVDPHRLFLTDNPMEACRSFVDAVPVTNVIFRLRVHRHRDQGFPLEQHDRTDMGVLARAIPHCPLLQPRNAGSTPHARPAWTAGTGHIYALRSPI